MNNQKSEIQTLTGLRGFAALLVFVTHCSYYSTFLPRPFHIYGHVGVMLFFVLSGFLLGYLYLEQKPSVQNIFRYSTARIGRVVPVYILVVLVSYIVTIYIYPKFYYQINNKTKFFEALLFLYAPKDLWTIPVELQFYLYFLGFWFLYQKKSLRFLLVVCFLYALAPAIYNLLLTREAGIGFWKKINFLNCSLLFFAGVYISILYQKDLFLKKLKWLADRLGIVFLVLIIFNVPSLKNKYFYIPYGSSLGFQDPITIFLIIGLFVCALLNSATLGVLKTKFFIFLGVISYGFYLINSIIIQLVAKMIILDFMRMPLAFILTALLSYLSFRFFEKPTGLFIRSFGLKNKLHTPKTE